MDVLLTQRQHIHVVGSKGVTKTLDTGEARLSPHCVDWMGQVEASGDWKRWDGGSLPPCVSVEMGIKKWLILSSILFTGLCFTTILTCSLT
jgi:hypothetical protein